MLRQARRLQQEAAQLPELPAAQKELCASRVAQVAQFKQQSEALQAAAAALEQHMADCTEQVHAANDAVLEDIAAGFSELCGSLLPSLQLQLARTGQQAHEGLQFRFRRLEDAGSGSAAAAAADEGRDSQWITSLGQLSGGQQTLVSLAMLLAVARSGNGSSLFLMDEIDAALDEHNQARASALLRQLSHATDGSGCQILCVTHNAAFQTVCDAFVQVVRGPHGSSMPAAAAAAADVAPEGGRDSSAAGSKKGKGRAAVKGKVGASSDAKDRTGAAAAGQQGLGSRRREGRLAKKVRFQSS
ncbi:hypothetical protein OEZ86_001147 [Tetradesmus obliquus]|nr:hypothetical protein OEZ86_001147 [Tetradesmus obliquus]